ncbi:MAG: cupin domain-containing protein [Kofleriaceae bacterium]
MTIQDLLPLYALGLLEGEEAASVAKAIEADPGLARELAGYDDALIMPIAPPAELERRLMASVGGGRFERFTARISQLFDLSVERTRELLGLTERAASWGEEAPRVFLIHFDAGPAVAMADCGIVRIAPGGVFPPHMHRGEESTIVISGALRDHDGKVYRAGDELVYAPGSSHLLTVEGDEDVIFVARAFAGIELQLPPQS